MVYQMFFGFMFLLNMVLYSHDGQVISELDGISKEKLSILNVDVYQNVEQVGIVEFLPLTSGFKIRVNMKGEHSFSVFNQAGEMILQSCIPTPFEYHSVRGLKAGIYSVVIEIDEERLEILRIPVDE